MTPATSNAPRPRSGDIARMFKTPHSRSRRAMDHSHRVVVVREVPRPAASLAF